MILTPVLDYSQHRAFIDIAVLFKNKANEVTIQLEEKKPVIFC